MIHHAYISVAVCLMSAEKLGTSVCPLPEHVSLVLPGPQEQPVGHWAVDTATRRHPTNSNSSSKGILDLEKAASCTATYRMPIPLVLFISYHVNIYIYIFMTMNVNNQFTELGPLLFLITSQTVCRLGC